VPNSFARRSPIFLSAPRDGLIATDTGAFGTGRLTAALIDDGAVRFIEA
jgi:hypothetical protein